MKNGDFWDVMPCGSSVTDRLAVQSQVYRHLSHRSTRSSSDERTGLYCTRTIVTGSFQRWVQVSEYLRPHLSVSLEIGFPFCRLLQLAELRLRYNSP
jgi:hypothetical protein